MRLDRALMTQEVEFFRTNGFVVQTGLLSEDEVAPISDEIDKIIEGSPARLEVLQISP